MPKYLASKKPTQLLFTRVLIYFVMCVFIIFSFISIFNNKNKVSQKSTYSSPFIENNNTLYEGDYTIKYEYGRYREGEKPGNIYVYKNEKLLWHFNQNNDNFSKPVINNNVLFVLTEPARVVALALETGEIVWQQAIADDIIHSDYTVPIITPTHILAKGSKGLYAFDLNDGKKKWQWQTPENNFISMVLNDSHTIFIHHRSNSKPGSTLVALHAHSGNIVWQHHELISKGFPVIKLNGMYICIKSAEGEKCLDKLTGVHTSYE